MWLLCLLCVSDWVRHCVHVCCLVSLQCVSQSKCVCVCVCVNVRVFIAKNLDTCCRKDIPTVKESLLPS